MAWRDLSSVDDKWTWLTGILTIFLCWLSQEILERRCGLEPAIRDANEFLHEKMKRASNPQKVYKINRRITKSLDISGRYRVTTRGTIYYIKGVWCALLLLTSLFVLIAYPDWYYDHFITMDKSTVNFAIYRHLSASIATFYAWEVVTNRYGRLSYSLLAHHWLTTLAALAILLGVYTPFATHYAYTAIGMASPVVLIMGFRATVSNKYPVITRKLFKFSTYWYGFIVIINVCGQCYLLIAGFITNKIHIVSLVLMLFTMFGWMFDDWQLLKALQDFSTHDYEDAELYSKKSLNREFGGRRLFADAVLHDVEMEKQLTAMASNKIRDVPTIGGMTTISPSSVSVGDDSQPDYHVTLDRKSKDMVEEMNSGDLNQLKRDVSKLVTTISLSSPQSVSVGDDSQLDYDNQATLDRKSKDMVEEMDSGDLNQLKRDLSKLNAMNES